MEVLLSIPTPQRGHPWGLRLRLGLILAGITALALVSMGGSMVIAEGARGDAAAINQAGSLRMESYRIAALLQEPADAEAVASAAATFEAKLNDAALREVAAGDPSLQRRYREIRDEWRDVLRPALADTGAEGAATYTAQVGTFVDSVDAMVRALQQQAESRIQLLRATQAGAIVLTLLLAAGAIALMQRRVMTPMRDLIDAADRLGQGDFYARAAHTHADEFGVLGERFNTMAAELDTLYADMEQQVAHKTADLQRSIQALQLLYDTARDLAPHRLTETTMQPILDRLRDIVGAGPVDVDLTEPDGDEVVQRFRSTGAEDGTTDTGTTIVLRHRGQTHGLMRIRHPAGATLAAWKHQLAAAVADQIALARALAREAQQQRRLVLMEERAVLARELHDSLAQSLSYLKIQVARLQAGLRGTTDRVDTESIAAELREGLNTAYGHLRELLTTFRLKVNEPGLQPALEATIREFRQRCPQLALHLDTGTTELELDSNAEVHALQIVREALANVAHHASATRAVIRLTKDDNNQIRLLVQDDGVGMPEQPEKAHHYGIQIMAERARSLGGELMIDAAEPQGTRVQVTFPLHRATGDNDMEHRT
ncbi:type IV pili methyl-accepting chemotaxis transducer N-terminal domain-containing protein [Aquisalimonas asiatica]|uniref:Sensor protein n=1 Tax=Aquisalimonas asiatica TaxID=406100 RepID=A0A1H8PV37_9GAMM|nr:type IV pili methyl-accepting chemotaxis transducer N-terminal domain-containing protein [Aquisalimonas asiatica]SEO45805.1 two-component system, NarL family, nitrate/nitrite sensor histidine kinase NarX [Aquisalimonas asiatica]